MAPAMPPPAADYVLLQDATFRGPGGPCFPHTTWRLPADERWAVRGASGAGKSRFVAALVGRLPRLEGRLRHPFLEGRPRCQDTVYGVLPPGSIAVASMDEHRSLLAAREFHQLRWHASLATGRLTVAEHLAREAVEGLSPYVVATDDDRAARYPALLARQVDRFELEPLLPRALLALSNGELHRVLLARALLLEPRLLIVDDPFAGLDADTRARLAELLGRLPDEGTAVLHVAARDEDVAADVTHEIELVEATVVRAGPRRSQSRTVVALTGNGEARAPAPRAAPAPEPTAPVLEIRDLTVRLGGVPLLAGVSWTIRAGERWALVGRNGAGKSTLLAVVLADHPQAHASDVTVCGRRLGPGTSIWDVKRCLGWVSPELDAHYPAGTPALDVVLSGFRASLGVHQAPAAGERAAATAWLERFALAAHAATAFDALPRCERRLVLLARAAVHAPRLLLLDEPCQGLDAADRSRFAGALELALDALGAALVYVTHDPGERPPGVAHTLELVAGRAVVSARPPDAAPATPGRPPLRKAGLFVVEGGRVLLCRKRRGTSRLILPGGRHEAGEDDLACLARELAEELGPSVTATGLERLGRYEHRAAYDDPAVEQRVIIELYAGRLAAEPRASGEIAELVWFAEDDDWGRLAPSLAEAIFPDLIRRGRLPWALGDRRA